MIAHLDGLNYFFLDCQMWLASTSSLIMANFIKTISFCMNKFNMGLHGSDPINFTIFDKVFL
jgi:hypothetical protein